MNVVKTTRLSRLLEVKGLLRHRLEYLGMEGPSVAGFLRRVRVHGPVPPGEVGRGMPLDVLREYGLLEVVDDAGQESRAAARPGGRAHRVPLAGVRAVNFELTYRCNSDCPHCLQKNLRDLRADREMSSDLVRQVVHDAWFSGVVEEGVNFTGGEVLSTEIDIFSLIGYARSLGPKVRFNSSGWWGKRSSFSAGGRHFASPNELVRTLKENGLTMFAFSYDERYHGHPAGLLGLAGSIAASEANGLNYQIICTGCRSGEVKDVCTRLSVIVRAPVSRILDHVVRMDMVDMGGVADGRRKSMKSNVTPFLSASCADCRLRGFYHPALIHIDPYGGVRSCLYAPGLKNMGNVKQDRFFDIINRFPSDEVSLAFRSEKMRSYAEELFLPHADIYRPFSYPCTAAALLARLIEKSSDYETKHGHPVDGDELRQINVAVAREMNLLKPFDI